MKKDLQVLKKRGGDFGAELASFIIRYKWVTLAVSILVVLAAGMGAGRMTFNGDYHVFFSEDNPQLKAFDALQNKYTKDDNVFILFEPADKNVFTARTLKAIENFTKEAWKTPHSTRVDAITNFQYTRSQGDELFVEDLVQHAETKSQEDLDQIRQIATSDPRIINRLVNKKGSATAVNITIKIPDGADPKINDEVAKYVREQLAKFQKEYPEIKTYTSGTIMLSNAFNESSSKDLSTLTPLMFLMIAIVVFFFTRTVTGTISTLIVVIFSIVIAMGVGGWLGFYLTPASASFMNIIMTLAIADSIHIISTFVHGMKRGLGKRDAIIESMRVNYLAVFLTSFTTAIGFLSMNFSDSPPFRDLGNLTSMGMAAAWLFSVTTLPALLMIFPVKFKRAETTQFRFPNYLEQLAEFTIARSRWVVAGSFAAVLISAGFVFMNDLNDEFIKYFSKDVKFRSDTDHISENLTGVYTIEFSINSGEPGGINKPEYLAKLQEFENWLYSNEDVVHVNSFTEISRQVNKSMHGDDSLFYRLPDNREEAAQFLLLYEMSLPFGLDLNNQVNVDKSETRVIVTTNNIPSKQMIALEESAKKWLVTNAPDYMQTDGVSTIMMFSHLTQRQIYSMMSGNVWALVLISIVLALWFKSARYGFVSLVPNIAPVIMGLGFWGLFAGYINTGISSVFGMTLGIIVDDTIHFIAKYLRARRELGKSPDDSVRYVFSTTGHALVATTVVLILGFLVIAQSDFGLNSGMAKITMIIIGLALAFDLLFMPALLVLIDREKTQSEPIRDISEQAAIA